jgi:hypothetical protein
MQNQPSYQDRESLRSRVCMPKTRLNGPIFTAPFANSLWDVATNVNGFAEPAGDGRPA